jgi:drug/metabolite transporter (DMT)-like permease
VTRSAAARWLLLAALWSLQFIFMRLAVPVFGTAVVAESRALLGALFLLPYTVWVLRQSFAPRAHWRDYLAVGLTNNVLPFLFYAWAATTLPAGYLSVINGLVPLWAAVFAAWLLHERLRFSRIAGFTLGIAGVALIARYGPLELDTRTLLGTLAAVAATTIWGWAGVVIKQRNRRVPSMELAAGSIASAALVMTPLLIATPAPASWSSEAIIGMLGLGLLISGLAYVPFFTLIRDIGATRTLAVGLTVPVLGIVWGWLVLGEPITASMFAGAALVVIGLVLVMKR